MNKIEEIETKSSLVYFPIVHDRVESFLLAHWEQVWQDCRTLTWKEWLHSSCYDLFRSEVIDDILASNHVLELSPVKEITKS
ncbi:hypothetical protein CR203_00275 [Salipaludibacillus neizhouensis]|uniref:Uncharacterized protein n=1 Tax=Salipaludibacillus neizhouensis TaxID=885475 RepID=A0A3A9KDI6_9BACI|nr:hypothetical protein [Salipaludibacillus neizhouensis]RKL68531.1 hypothetical protein CR203_00275 [Salipaludibacillus neizhouensis]